MWVDVQSLWLFGCIVVLAQNEGLNNFSSYFCEFREHFHLLNPTRLLCYQTN